MGRMNDITNDSKKTTGFFERAHQRKLEIIQAEGKQTHHFYPVLDLGNFGIALILVVMVYGFFVAPCSFEAQGKFSGNFVLDVNKLNKTSYYNNPFSEMKVSSFEGKISGQAPCVAIIYRSMNSSI